MTRIIITNADLKVHSYALIRVSRLFSVLCVPSTNSTL